MKINKVLLIQQVEENKVRYIFELADMILSVMMMKMMTRTMTKSRLPILLVHMRVETT